MYSLTFFQSLFNAVPEVPINGFRNVKINNKPAGRSELIIVLKAPPTAKAYIPINRKMIKINKQTAMYTKAT